MHMIFTLIYIKLRNLDFQFDEVSNSNLAKECDSMSKKTLSLFLFVISFVVTYSLLCLVYTGGKMALEATTFDYIRVAIIYMALFKTIVSLVVASVVGAIPMIIGRRKE